MAFLNLELRFLPVAFIASVTATPPVPAGAVTVTAGPVTVAEVIPQRAAVAVPVDWYDGRPTVHVSVGGSAPLRFIIDTGAMVSLLRADVAERLGLEPTDRTLIGDPSGREPQEVPLYTFTTLTIGDEVFPDVPAIGLEGGPIVERMGDVSGVLSPNVFEGWIMTLDLSADELRFERGRLVDGDGSEPYPDTGRPFPAAEVVVAGTSIMADIDTGNGQGLALPTRFLSMVDLAEGPDTTEATMLTGSFPIVRGVLTAPVSYSGIVVESAPVHFHDAYPHANIGAPLLRGTTIVLDPTNRRLMLS